jgi:PKD repeat protein
VTLSGATTATPSFTPTAVGVYTFTLVVTDSTGLASAPDQVVITVTNQPLLRLYLPLVTRQP